MCIQTTKVQSLMIHLNFKSIFCIKGTQSNKPPKRGGFELTWQRFPITPWNCNFVACFTTFRSPHRYARFDVFFFCACVIKKKTAQVFWILCSCATRCTTLAARSTQVMSITMSEVEQDSGHLFDRGSFCQRRCVSTSVHHTAPNEQYLLPT